MLSALSHWPRAQPGVPCAACLPTYQVAQTRFDAVVANNDVLRQTEHRIHAELDAEMEFMTEGTFGRDTESRVTARVRTYETGKWAGWKGYGRRGAAGTPSEDRYTKFYIEPSNCYRVEGYEAAVAFGREIEKVGLRQAVQNMSMHPTRTHRPQLVTTDWLLDAAESRNVRRRTSGDYWVQP